MRKRNTIVAVLVSSSGKVLMGKNSRNNTHTSQTDKGTWKFIQGGIEESETSEQALKRELLEEINYEPTNFKKIKGTYSYTYNDENGNPDCKIVLHPFIIISVKQEKYEFDEKEFSELQWIQPKDIHKLPLGIRKRAYLEIIDELNSYVI